MVSSRCPGLRPDGAGSNDCSYCTTKIRSRARWAGDVAACCAGAAARARAPHRRAHGDANDPIAKTWVSAFTPAASDLGWTNARNVRTDLRWAAGDSHRI